MAKNPFGKTRDKGKPYAIYRAGDFVWHVCKTYKTPENEAKDQYARWFVWAKSSATFGSFEGGDTYRNDVLSYGQLVAAEPEWLEAQRQVGARSWGNPVPTPQEYLAQA